VYFVQISRVFRKYFAPLPAFSLPAWAGISVMMISVIPRHFSSCF